MIVGEYLIIAGIGFYINLPYNNLEVIFMDKPKTPVARKTASPNQKSMSTEPIASASQLNVGNSLLQKFVVEQLKDIYWAEKHLLKAIPKMMKAASNPGLKAAFEEHLTVTEEHIQRLETVFEMMGKKAQAKKCEAMEGLTKEAEQMIEETEDGSVTRDVAIIMAAQKVEHYEIATYGGLVKLTRTMGMHDAAEILEKTLREEKMADQMLTAIAEKGINVQAEQETTDDED